MQNFIQLNKIYKAIIIRDLANLTITNSIEEKLSIT